MDPERSSSIVAFSSYQTYEILRRVRASQTLTIRNSSAMKVKFESVPLADFWAYAVREVSELADVAVRARILFVTTYLCKTGF